MISRQVAAALPQTLKEIGIVFLVGYYLFLVALANIPALTWKQFRHSFWRIAIYNIHKTLLLLLITALLVAGGLYLIYLSLNYPEQGWLVLGSSLLLLVLMVLLLIVVSLSFFRNRSAMVEEPA